MPKYKILKEIEPKMKIVSTKPDEKDLEDEVEENESFSSGGNFSDMEIMERSGSPTLEMSGERQETPEIPEDSSQRAQAPPPGGRIQGQIYETTERRLEEDEREYQTTAQRGPGGEIAMASGIRRSVGSDINEPHAFERRPITETSAFDSNDSKYDAGARDETGRVRRRMPWE